MIERELKKVGRERDINLIRYISSVSHVTSFNFHLKANIWLAASMHQYGQLVFSGAALIDR